MGKNLNIGMLLDFYGELLTEKQSDAIDFYYNQDFSLSEIAEEMKISRQGARDLIKRSEERLLELEDALGLVKRFSEISSALSEIKKCCGEIHKDVQKKEVHEKIEEITDLIKKINDKI